VLTPGEKWIILKQATVIADENEIQKIKEGGENIC
jgi:hypothetical protein